MFVGHDNLNQRNIFLNDILNERGSISELIMMTEDVCYVSKNIKIIYINIVKTGEIVSEDLLSCNRICERICSEITA